MGQDRGEGAAIVRQPARHSDPRGDGARLRVSINT
jgi:hypothetical protein